MNCPQKRCEPSCAFCLDANEPFLAAPLIFLFSYNARTGYQRSAKRECRQGLRIVRYHFFEKAGKRLSCGPAIFAKKLQKSRETYNFTAFYGGPNRDRTDDLTDANRTLSQLSYRPIFGYFVYFCLIYLCGLLFWQGRCYVALALPTELRARLYLVCINFSYLDCAICWNTWACVMLPLLSQLSYGPIYLSRLTAKWVTGPNI